MHNAADERRLTEWRGDTFRLIPSRFPPVAVYDGLVANDRIEPLVELENLTNPRLQSASRIRSAGGVDLAESPRLQNWNHAPFTYVNPEGSHFFGPERPCLELADDKQTALAVSVARREKFLRRTREPSIGLDMRMLITPVSGLFVDFRDLPLNLARDDRWRLGAAVAEEVVGVLYHPPERPSATCIAVLRNTALGRTVQSAHYRYVWTGSRIASLYSFDNDGQVILPESLSGKARVLAA